MIDGGLLQDAAQMKLDVLSAKHSVGEAWRLITPTTINNCFVKYGFSTDHVGSISDSAVKLTEDEEDNWHSLQPLGVQSANQVLDQHLTRRQKEPEEEEEDA
jgi:hypothetical protein